MKQLTNLHTTGNHYDVFTYRRLRRAIGYLGILLPIILVTASFVPFFHTSIQPSISHYYYTNFREIFTGTLAAVGLFMIRYKGRKNPSFLKNESLLTNLAGFMAIGVAFVPTNPLFGQEKIYTFIPYCWKWLGGLHYGFAGLLFVLFAILSIKVFTLGQKDEVHNGKSIFDENNIYRFCGYSILVFLVMVPVSAKYNLFPNSTLVFEALSLFVFGLSWLIKGRVLGDKGKIGEKVYKEYNIENTEKQEQPVAPDNDL